MTDIPLNTYIEWTKEDRAHGKCPVPAGSEVTLYGANYGYEWEFDQHTDTRASHRITFDLIDGKPDRDSIKMEEL